jgi:hypothetical protein
MGRNAAVQFTDLELLGRENDFVLNSSVRAPADASADQIGNALFPRSWSLSVSAPASCEPSVSPN